MHDDKFKKGMRGEFRGDFTRDTFDPFRHFSRVLMQQGRVQLDADWNEQVSILWYYFRKLGADLMGPHGAPRTEDGNVGQGFKISAIDTSFTIAPGHYYVNGILCENNEEALTYHTQLDLPFTQDEMNASLTEGDYLIYLDIWERHLSYVEDDYIREKALAGPDTATRSKIVWQVKVIKHEEFENTDINPGIDLENFKSKYNEFLQALMAANVKKPGSGLLKARARKKADDNEDPCLTSPEASYRRPENQLYRVEIHKGGRLTGEEVENGNGPTFKWSRENGSVIFPIKEFSGGTIVTLEHLGKDCRTGLKSDDWVEIIDDDYILRNRAEKLVQVMEVDAENMQVILKDAPESPVETGTDINKHPYIRRWDQKGDYPNGLPVKEGNKEQDWILLEAGVEIQFPTPDTKNIGLPHDYQTGDYWLIPARTATGDVEWPGDIDDPHVLPPQGVEHHYAPLAKIEVQNDGAIQSPVEDLRRKFKKNWD